MSISSAETQNKPASDETPASGPDVAPESSSLVRWLILTGLLVALGLGGMSLIKVMPKTPGELFAAAQPKGPPGKAVIDEKPQYDFGVMPNQTKGKHVWVLKNEGAGELTLKKGEVTCKCTIANFELGKDSFTLGAGKSTEIALEWDTKENDGKYHQKAEILILNDPDRESIKFEIDGIVKPAITVYPKQRTLEFGSIASNESMKAKFAIASADRPELKILEMTSTNPNSIGLSTEPLTDTDRTELELSALKGGYKIVVEVKPAKTLGLFREEITVTTDHPRLREVKVLVGGKRVGPITAVPDTIRMHNVRSEEGGTASIVLVVRNAPETSFKVVEVPENLKVEVIPSDVKNGIAVKVRSYKMVVTVTPDTPSGVIDGMITLKVNHPDVSELKIPVDISVIP